MKTKIPGAMLVALAGFGLAVAAEEPKDTPTLESIDGSSTTSHANSPAPRRTRRELIDGREPTSPPPTLFFDNYGWRWTCTVPDPRPSKDDKEWKLLTLRVWNPIAQRFPGSNIPVVEVFADGIRVSCNVLAEVGWASDVWTASHQGKSYLYVETKHRHRTADGTNLYELNPDTMKLEHKGVLFSKDELERELQASKASSKRMEDQREKDRVYGEGKAPVPMPAPAPMPETGPKK